MFRKLLPIVLLFVHLYMYINVEAQKKEPVDLVYPLLDAAHSRWFYSARNIYIGSASIDGRKLSSPYITQSDINKGGTLVLEMGDSPDKVFIPGK